MKKWFASGTPWIWLNAAAVAISLIMVVGLLALIAVRGLGHFWPGTVYEFNYQVPGAEQRRVLGEVVDIEERTGAVLRESGYPVPEDLALANRILVKQGNRDLTGRDFMWYPEPFITGRHTPEDALVLERREWGNFYGYLQQVKESGAVVAEGDAAMPELERRLERSNQLLADARVIERYEIGRINQRVERLRLEQRRAALAGETEARAEAFATEEAALQAQYEALKERLDALVAEARRDSLVATTMDGRQQEIPLAMVVHAFQPNAMGIFGKIGHYFAKVWEFLSDYPREANTEGGIFPAIFGTVMMVLIMSVVVTPFGVLAAIYLREYAKQGTLTRIVRISVNNLAGVPSIVFGVFGLGFFVYLVGGHIDQVFYEAALPAPTFGTPGLIWVSLTLALLTLPVVIVSTEEGLTRIPRAIREGSLALGATKSETLWRTVVPIAAPAMMTGLILAVARAAGEVAPLMLVGVVKLAPNLPVDSQFPFLHMERKIMHLGFHIYDVGFQSPNAEAARPLVYATALVLVAIIMVLNLSAIAIRNHLREKYRSESD
ncbi:MAG: phosphate ABC transporter permease PstA [Xanthomonadaceae bacterium]|nr:phosphate ABC transporter permease PstA [Xanthomonadaceae bacterium]